LKRLLAITLGLTLYVLVKPPEAGAVDAPHVNTCPTCHTSGLTPNSTGFNSNCLSCHSAGNAASGTPFSVTDQVNTSHSWSGSDSVPAAGAQPPTLGALTQVQSYTGNEMACVRCHNPHSNANGKYLRISNANDQLCLDCHRSRNLQTPSAGSHPVLIGYSSAAKANPSGFNQIPQNANPANPTSDLSTKMSADGKLLCSTCHGVHASDSKSTTVDGLATVASGDGNLLRTDPRGASVASGVQDNLNICTNCHAGKKNHNALGQDVQCNDCHGAHVDFDADDPTGVLGVNVNLIRRTVTKAGLPSKIFFRYTAAAKREYVNTDGTGAGVCQGCHAPPADHFSGTAVETAHANCTGCHPHNSAAGSFSPGAGGCTSCHGQPPVSAATTASGYTAYDETTTPHASHAAGGGTNYKYACFECHLGNTHNSGTTFTDVFIAKTGIKAGESAVYSLPDCSNVYCHSDGNGGFKAGQSSIAWGNNKKGTIIGQPGECTTCHDNISIATGSHAKHVSAMTYGCKTCHAATVSDNTTLLPAARLSGGTHVNAAKDVQFSNMVPATGSSCATVACHGNGKGASAVTAPVWGVPTSGACGSCHATAASTPALASGSHAEHFAVIGSTNPAVVCTQCHTYYGETAAPHVNGTVDMTAGCSTSQCHGTIAPPAWGFVSSNNLCTTCHGTGTVTVTAANRYVVAPSDAVATDTGKVSTNAKTGAHQTHLRMLNGLSAVGSVDERCQNCHGTLPVSGTHANGSSMPVFQGLATNNGSISASYAGTNCSNTYCHNPAGTGGTLNPANAGTGITPSWTNAGYIADGTVKTPANCTACHKVPGDAGFTSSTDHGSLTIASDCAGCHGHNGDTAGAAGQQHLDGIKFGNGTCDACHGYPPLSPAQFSARVGGTYVNAMVENYSGGGGHHATHLLTTVVASEGFAPCLPCHPSIHHNQGGGIVARTDVNVNDPADTTFRFDVTRSKRYDTVTLSCSNVSCHFQPTPAW